MSIRLAIGDILELQCGAGWAYLSYAGKDATMGDAVWVIPEVFEEQQRSWASIFDRPGFWLFYPAHATLRSKLVKNVGYSEDAIRMLPSLRRNIVAQDESGAVTSWYLTDGTRRVPKHDEELTEDERQLPISRIWNHAFLLEQLESGRLRQR